MSKIKKALLLALSMAMSATIFAACGGGDDDQSSSASSSSSSFELPSWQSSSSNPFEWSSSQGGASSSGEVNSGSQDDESGSSSSVAGSESTSNESNSSSAAGSESNSSSVAGSESNSSGAAGSESSSNESNSSVTPEVPEIPEVDGEQVADLNAWNAAWANTIAAKNIVAIYQDTYTYEGVTETEYGEALVADNKIYMCDYDDTNGNAYMYAGEVDGKTYQWESVDGENWVAEEILADMDVMATGYLIVRGLNEKLDFSTAVYENGYYVCTTEWATFNIKIAGGYVVEITMKDDTETMSYKMSFGNAVIGELPPLPQEEVIVGEAVKDEGEWDKILESTDNKTNFTYTAEGRMEGDDGKVGIATEYVAVDNGKVYVEMEQSIYNGDGSSMGSENRYYQGVVNGVAYQWYDVGGGEFYAREIEAVEDETIVALLDLQDLVFATATFDSVTGAYTFNTDGATIAIKVVDSLVRYVELSTEGMYVEYTISYDNANVELPSLENGGGEGSTEIEIDWNGPVGGDIIGEEVSEADFENAIVRSLKSDNFLVKGYVGSLSGSGETAVGYTQIADGKMYNYTSATYKEDGKEYNAEFSIYVGMVDGVEYMWYSEDGENYETGYAEEEGLVGCCNGSVFQMYFAFADYGVMQYDAETGAYVMQIPGESEGENFSLKIVDGQVVYFCISTVDGDMEQTFVIEYGNAYVGALPPVGEIGGGESGGDKVETLLPLLEIDFDDTLMEGIVGEQVTQDELREAIESTYAATNFVFRGDSYIEGGKSLYISHIADGKMRTLTQATYMEEGAGKLETTNMYQYSGNVDGTNYIWLSTDGEIWECALAEEVMVGSYGNGQEVFSSILDIFLLMDSSYNETSKEFYIDMSEAQGVFFSVRVVEGYVKTISMKFVDGMYMNYVVEYDCAEVGALPPVGEIGGGDVNIPENPDFDAMGQEVSQGEWEKAFYLFFNEQANVTVNAAFWMSMEEYYDETWHKYEGILDGVIYFSNGEMYERNQITGMEDGDNFSFTEEKYIVNKDGTYYEYYSDSIDTPNWVESMVRDEFDGTLASYILGGEMSVEEYIAMYAIADFNRETGEYTVYIEDEIDPYTIKFKFVDGLLFSLTIRFEDMESDSERGFSEERYVFTNYGDTYFEYPDFENGGGNFGGDEEVVVPEIELPRGEEVNAEVWEKAVADLKEANNFTANGTVTLDTPDYSVTVAMNMHIADNKGFSVVTVDGREQYSVVGNVDGKNYEWYSEDGKTWECECTGDAYDIDGTYFWNDMVGVDVTYDSVYFDEEIGGYVYDISETAYVIIGFTDGQVAFIVSYKQEEVGIDSCMEEKLVFVLSYGDAVVGELPPVENVVEDDVVIGGDEEMKEESMKA